MILKRIFSIMLFLSLSYSSSFAFQEQSTSQDSHAAGTGQLRIIPWDEICPCASLRESEVSNQLNCKLTTDTDGNVEYALKTMDDFKPISIKGGGIARNMKGMLTDRKPDAQFQSALGVGTLLRITGSPILLCGVLVGPGELNITKQGLELRGSYEFVNGPFSEGTASEFTEPPVAKLMYKPPYPRHARDTGIEGTVIAEVSVDKRGNVYNVEIIQSPHKGFDMPIIEALRKSKFFPAQRCGVNVKSKVLIPFEFNRSM